MKTALATDFAEAAQKWGREIFIKTADKNITFAEFYRRAAQSAAFLEEEGVEPGDRVALLMPASPEYLQILWALWMLKAVAVPLNTRWSAAEIAAACRQVECRLVVAGPGMPAPAGEIPLLRPSEIKWERTESPYYQISTDDSPATIIFTSGSTGRPKGVVHSLANHYYSALGSAANLTLKKGDVWLLSLPLFHVGGLAIPIRCWLGGAAVAIGLQTETLSEQILRFRPTHLSLVATQLLRLMAEEGLTLQLSRAKAVLLGGSAVPERLIAEALQSGVTALTSYGSSEMASQICTTPADQPELSLAGSGKLLLWRELRIDPRGEILVKGPTLALGYWQNGRIVPLPLRNGWLPTGDRGKWGPQNILQVSGRVDNMFISGGENIYPEEIEKAVMQLPQVRSALVVPVPDETFGQRPALFVEWQSGRQLTLLQLRERLRQQLAGYKLPAYLLEWPADFPQKSIKPNRKYFQALAVSLLK